MINGKKILAIIPARAGSKRVLNKNTRELCGHPLIGWTLKDLKSSKYIDHCYVSTDSLDIQKIAKAYSVDCDPLRSSELSQDDTTTFDVVQDIIETKKKDFDILVLLQPTSPLRSLEDIDKSLEFFCEKNANSVTSVCEAESHPSWSSPLPEDKAMDELIKKLLLKRSQDLETYYKLNGAIYIISIDKFREAKAFFAKERAFAYLMKRTHSIDIDTEEDLLIAECLLRIKTTVNIN
jgi:CMP-N,N'-diacetyllegionaminic acid synthase